MSRDEAIHTNGIWLPIHLHSYEKQKRDAKDWKPNGARNWFTQNDSLHRYSTMNPTAAPTSTVRDS